MSSLEVIGVSELLDRKRVPFIVLRKIDSCKNRQNPGPIPLMTNGICIYKVLCVSFLPPSVHTNYKTSTLLCEAQPREEGHDSALTI